MKGIQSKRLKTKIYPSVSKLLRPNRKFTAILEQNCKSKYWSACFKDYAVVWTKKNDFWTVSSRHQSAKIQHNNSALSISTLGLYYSTTSLIRNRAVYNNAILIKTYLLRYLILYILKLKLIFTATKWCFRYIASESVALSERLRRRPRFSTKASGRPGSSGANGGFS